jgi:2-C-methyl-D-erythritol 4-phosphate cytidylyltransferase
MRTAIPKTFLSLKGKPLFTYCLHTLARVSGIGRIVVVVAADLTNHAEEILARQAPWPVDLQVVAGGAERQDSVAAGLKEVNSDLVLVHDAARPFVSAQTVASCLDAAVHTGAAVVAVPARDTVKLTSADGTVAQTLDRHRVWLAQTPQVFQTAVLQRAHAQARRDGFVGTDDAALVERIGVTVWVVPGEPENKKITSPEDLRWAEWVLSERPQA